MLKGVLLSAAAIAAVGSASMSSAKEYVDYTYETGFWEINAIEVDPNHIDDYLVGLKQSQNPALEVMKAHGLIDDYHLVVKRGYAKGTPNVLIMLHIPNIATLAPDKARDQALEKEIYAKFSEEQGKKMVAQYETYRKFIEDAYWQEVTFTK